MKALMLVMPVPFSRRVKRENNDVADAGSVLRGPATLVMLWNYSGHQEPQGNRECNDAALTLRPFPGDRQPDVERQCNDAVLLLGLAAGTRRPNPLRFVNAMMLLML